MTKFNNYKYRANKKNILFLVKEDDFKKLENSCCLYCGTDIKIGIDRLDNNQGYVDDNITACCWRCNRAKSNMELKEFLNWIRDVSNHFRHIDDPNLTLTQKYEIDMQHRVNSNALDLKEYEEDAISRFISHTLSVTNLSKEIIHKVFKSNIKEHKKIMVSWIYGIDNSHGKDYTDAYFKFFKTPNYLSDNDKRINPELLQLLLDNTKLSKNEIRSLKDVKINLYTITA